MDRSAVARVSTNKRVLSVTPLACHRITYSVSFHLALKGTITLLHFARASSRGKKQKNKENKKQKQKQKTKNKAKTKQKQKSIVNYITITGSCMVCITNTIYLSLRTLG